MTHILTKLDDSYTIRKIKFTTGKLLGPGEISSTGLYAITKAHNNWALRISLFPEIAELYRDSSRDIRECYITQIQ